MGMINPPSGILVHGAVDEQTRCTHYATGRDVIAIRFACCGEAYPCHLCHEQLAGHPASVWPKGEQHIRAILCGVCGSLLAIRDYRAASACPACHAPFNPGCRLHEGLYFEL